MYDQSKVVCVVLNYKGLSDTLDCLESLAKQNYEAYSVIVVDNASRDGSAEIIEAKFPAVQVIVNNLNLGYAGGNNVGLSKAFCEGAEYVLLLNNDTIIDRQCIFRLVEAAKYDRCFVGYLEAINHAMSSSKDRLERENVVSCDELLTKWLMARCRLSWLTRNSSCLIWMKK